MAFDDSKHPRGDDPKNKGRFSRRKYPEAEGVQLGPQPSLEQIPPGVSPTLLEVLESAADLQKKVPDAVLVGGSAAALYAEHRASYDHDHVLQDLRDRHDIVLQALEEEPQWVTNRSVAGKIILGQIGDIEAGVRQLIRRVPLEVAKFQLPSGKVLSVPTKEEALRIKAFLLVRRNQARDYLDVAALSERYGTELAATTLRNIDAYYTDPDQEGAPLAGQVQRQLLQAAPKDSRTIKNLPQYKDLKSPWQSWDHTKEVLREVAAQMLIEGSR